ncbi:MAG: hypothetical protein OXC80_07645 [Gammaproteobacteria bacterium]|nr:hypothetical protein [Gammaproteobacteria bacterium]
MQGSPRRLKVRTTVPADKVWCSEDRALHEFVKDEPNRVWYSDAIQIPMEEGVAH